MLVAFVGFVVVVADLFVALVVAVVVGAVIVVVVSVGCTARLGAGFVGPSDFSAKVRGLTAGPKRIRCFGGRFGVG